MLNFMDTIIFSSLYSNPCIFFFLKVAMNDLMKLLLLICFLTYIILAAIVSGGKGTAQDKIKTLRDVGATVVESPAKIGVAMLDVFKQRGLVS